MAENNQQNNTQQTNRQKPQQRKGGDGPRFNFSWIYFILIAGLVYLVFSRDKATIGSTPRTLTYTDFQECVDSGYVQHVEVDRKDLNITFDVNTQGEDHIYDDTRYFLMSDPIKPTRKGIVDSPLFDPFSQ